MDQTIRFFIILILIGLVFLSKNGSINQSNASYSANQVTDLTHEMTHTMMGSSEDLSSRVQWNQTYGGLEYDVAYSVIQTMDGGFMIAGYTNSFGAGDYQVWLIKTDARGSPQWNRTYGDSGGNRAYSIIQTFDEGYAFAGKTLTDEGGCDFWLVKIDETGNIEWSQSYGGRRADLLYSMIQTTDGCYVLVGRTKSFGTRSDRSHNAWVVKTDPFGEHLWNQTFGGSFTDCFQSVTETPDGGYALAGYTDSYGIPYSKNSIDDSFWLVKVDRNGVLQWSQTYGDVDSNVCFDIIATSDGGLALAGHSMWYGWLVKTDTEGKQLWNQTYDSQRAPIESIIETSDGGWNQTYDSRRAWIESIIETSDGGFALAGASDSIETSYPNFWLVKTDVNGITQWNQTISTSGYDEVHSVIQTCDDDFVIAGETSAYGAGIKDAWLVKIRSGSNENNIPGSCTPSVIPPTPYKYEPISSTIPELIPKATQLTFNMGSDAYASFSGDGSKITYHSDVDGDWEIFVVNTNGSNRIKLTNNSASDVFPAINGDGSKIVFVSDVDGDQEIFVVNTDGSNLTQLTFNTCNDSLPVISWDGSKIAFHSDRDHKIGIFVMNADGTNVIPLTSNIDNGLYPSISDDGSKIAFQSYLDEDYEIFIVNIDGTNLTQLTNNSVHDTKAIISGDGSKIAFYSGENYDIEVYVMNADGTGLTKLTDFIRCEGDGRGPSISGDGSKITFYVYKKLEWVIYIVNMDGSGLTQITNDYNNDRFPVISRDGSMIAFHSDVDGDYEIFVWGEPDTDGYSYTPTLTVVQETQEPLNPQEIQPPTIVVPEFVMVELVLALVGMIVLIKRRTR